MVDQLLGKPFVASIRSRMSDNSSLFYKGPGIWGRGSSLLVFPLRAWGLLRTKGNFRILCNIPRRHHVSHCIEGKQPSPPPGAWFWEHSGGFLCILCAMNRIIFCLQISRTSSDHRKGLIEQNFRKWTKITYLSYPLSNLPDFI